MMLVPHNFDILNASSASNSLGGWVGGWVDQGIISDSSTEH